MVEVEATLLVSGQCRAPEFAIKPGGRWRFVDVPALIAHLEHPVRGTVLFDTGYATRFKEATRRLPYRYYRYATPVRMGEHENAVARLRARGVEPTAVKTILLSHFDPDHIGGLRDFPEARIVCHREAWEFVRGKTGRAAVKARLLPGLLPDDVEARLELLEGPTGPAVGPFTASYDIFDDGSVLLVDLPGHAPGQLGALLHLEGGQRWLLVADAIWCRQTLQAKDTFIHQRINHDQAAQEITLERLRQLEREQPDIDIVPAHCPETAARLATST